MDHGLHGVGELESPALPSCATGFGHALFFCAALGAASLPLATGSGSPSRRRHALRCLCSLRHHLSSPPGRNYLLELQKAQDSC